MRDCAMPTVEEGARTRLGTRGIRKHGTMECAMNERLSTGEYDEVETEHDDKGARGTRGRPREGAGEPKSAGMMDGRRDNGPWFVVGTRGVHT